MAPQIADKVENITVALGRDAKLQCQVKNLHDYKVNPIIYPTVKLSSYWYDCK